MPNIPSKNIEKPITIDLLDTSAAPALSSTTDMPVIETKPDATNEGAPPAVAETAKEETPEAESAETTSESATEPENEPSASDEPKKAKGVQKRLDELTKQREQERARAEAAEQRLDRALQALEKMTGQPAAETKAEIAQTDPEPTKPNRADFPDIEAYEVALGDYVDKKATWTARREIQAAQAEERQQRELQAIEEGQEKARQAYNERVQKVKEQFSDYDDVAESPDVQVPIPVAYAIINDPDGPAIQYYLGKHPDEAKKLFELSPPQQLVALGKMVAKMQTPAPAPAPKPPVSAAPAPIKPLKTGGDSGPSKSLEDMSMEEYAAHRRAQRQQSAARH